MAFTADRPEDADHPLAGTGAAEPCPAEHAPPLLPTARAEEARRPGPAAGEDAGPGPEPRPEPFAPAGREEGSEPGSDTGTGAGEGEGEGAGADGHAEYRTAGRGADNSDTRADGAERDTAHGDGARAGGAPSGPEDNAAGTAPTAPEPAPSAPRGEEHRYETEPGPARERTPEPQAPEDLAWNDGLIARRAPWARVTRPARPFDIERIRPDDRPEDTAGGSEGAGGTRGETGPAAGPGNRTRAGSAGESGTASAEQHLPAAPVPPPPHTGFSRTLRTRLEALRELVGLSAARLDAHTLAEAGHVLDEAVARHRLSLDHTVVALAGAGGSGKSTLFNALAGAPVSEAGIRRPTTTAPLACTWSDGADGLLDRLGVPSALRRRAPRRTHEQWPGLAPGPRPGDAGGPAPGLDGLVLLDLPDHDSALPGHRRQVDRLLGLVDAVVWVVDPEKYADAVLHERYLRPLAGYDEVTFVVLNQTDRLPGDAAHRVLHDLRRLLDEDGLAVGEHGEPGAVVLALSALTGEGVGELRDQLARFVAARTAAERRLAADVDGAADRLAPVCLAGGWTGLSARGREEFEDRLAASVGAAAAGQAAERAWLSRAEQACGTPWTRLRHRRAAGRSSVPSVPPAVAMPAADGPAAGSAPGRDAVCPGPDAPVTVPAATAEAGTAPDSATGTATGTGTDTGAGSGEPGARAARAVVEQAVRTLAGDATAGLPEPWARSVLDTAVSGTKGLAEALDRAAARPLPGVRPARPRWWTAVLATQWLLLVLQAAAAVWLVAVLTAGPAGDWPRPALLLAAASLGGPLLARVCRLAARGPARLHGRDTERWLRDASAACGRSRVLEPVAAELLRYREARAQHAVTAGSPGRL
ncbi:50S ribosome-binding GTPase [Streptomyces sp. WAC 00631]|uniref:GTPase n=1 Tax=Streptomyces sp. WAC 00631 TaxID=2203201 RepID=UPI001C8C6264|nr:GTPase [Streptomyces sp. WAC 00631]MCC5035079.1 50S ribosome-binding GTPase [Streptomyces sp. WAC 00631]